MRRHLPWPGVALAVLLVLAPGSGRVLAQERSGPETPTDRRTAVNAALSLALPGAGQLREGRSRGWAYVALEAVAWTFWAERRHAGGTLRTRYRDLAWDVGRIRNGPRVDGDFPYYETLSHWDRSGSFDAEPSLPGLQPETDPETYNGSIWALARGLYLPPGGDGPGSEAYHRALEYYEERAFGEAFLWDWTGDPRGRSELAGLIEESDDRFRQATLALGAVLANHLASAVDAFLSSSLDIDDTSLRVRPEVFGPRRAWNLSLHIGALP